MLHIVMGKKYRIDGKIQDLNFKSDGEKGYYMELIL